MVRSQWYMLSMPRPWDAAAGESMNRGLRSASASRRSAEVPEAAVGGAWLQGDEVEVDDAFAVEGQAQCALCGHCPEPASPCSGTVSEAWYVVHAEAGDGDGGFGDDAAVVSAQRTVTGIALSDRTRIQAVKS